MRKKPFIHCIVTEIEGGAPGKPGFKMTVFPDGSTTGTVGGGDIEHSAIKTALEMFSTKVDHCNETFILHQPKKSAKRKNAARKASHQTAMICGGSAKIFFEHYKAPLRALMFGGGHISQALAPLLEKLGFQIEIYDNRPAYATAEKYPAETIIHTGNYENMARSTELDESCFCLIVTHGHTHDGTVLNALLKQTNPAKYVGMIGSKKKVAKLLERAKKSGVKKERMKSIYTPIGLDIGGDSPFEIALSIAAEIQTIRYDKSAIHMKIAGARKS